MTKSFDTLTSLPVNGLAMAKTGFDLWLAAADRMDDLTRTWLDLGRQWRQDLAKMAEAAMPADAEPKKA